MGSDCDDTRATVHPGAPEICGNGIDDNCNGQVDENCGTCQNATNLTTTSITATSATPNRVASVNPVQWQVEYKTAKQGSKWMDVMLSGTLRSTTITGLKANQTYHWHIRAKCGNSWTEYSNVVIFSTQAVNLATTSYNASTATDQVAKEKAGLLVQVLPNPSFSYFTLVFQSSSNTPIALRVMDAVGETMEARSGVASNSTQLVGYSYRPGVYFVQVLQDGKMVMVKL